MEGVGKIWKLYGKYAGKYEKYGNMMEKLRKMRFEAAETGTLNELEVIEH